MNSYPFLDNKVKPVFTTELGSITPRLRKERLIDISNSPLVPAKDLRRKLEYLHMAGELDGGLPVVRHGVLVGLIPAPDLEFALDKLEDEETCQCLMATHIPWHGLDDEDGEDVDPTDFTPFIDPVGPTFSERKAVITYELSVGSSLIRHPFAHGPCISVLCQARVTVHLCS